MAQILRALLLTSFLFFSPLFQSASYAKAPCGTPDTDLANLTKFFSLRWKAIHTDLPAHHRETFLDHYELQGMGIVLIRVFHSQYQQKIAVVAARRLIEYEKQENKMISEIHCIVRINGSIMITISPRYLKTILNEGSPNI